MFNNDELVGGLADGTLSPEAAMEELQTTRATSSRGVSIGSIIRIIGPRGDIVEKAGYADWENSRLIDGDDIIRIYSVTKTFTAAMTHELFERGKLTPGSKVVDLIAEIKQRNSDEGHPEYNEVLTKLHLDERVTIDDLLLHRSGVGTYLFAMNRGDLNKTDTFYDVFSGNEKTSDNYGEFRYSDTNYNLQALIAIHVMNKRPDGTLIHPDDQGFRNFRAIMQELILTPYQLSNTAFTADSQKQMAVGYGPQTPYKVEAKETPTFAQLTEKRSSAPAPVTEPVHPYTAGAAAGLFTTAEDLSKWVRVLHHTYGDRIRAETMTIPENRPEAPAPSYVEGARYGRGAILHTVDGVDLIGHTGFHRGHITRAFYSPEHKTSVIITETFESITSNIAKELIKNTHIFMARSPEEQEKLLTSDRDVAADIRNAYSNDGKYDREKMVSEYSKYLQAQKDNRAESGTSFDAIVKNLPTYLSKVTDLARRATERPLFANTR